MRILLLARNWPWPPTLGGRMRVAATAEALAGIGAVDLFSLVYAGRQDAFELPLSCPLARSEIALLPDRFPLADITIAGRLRWAFSGFPEELAGWSFDDLGRRFRAWRRAQYDVIWFCRLLPWHVLGRETAEPIVIDFDDLEDRKERARLPTIHRTGRLRRRAARGKSRLNARRWSAIQQRAATRADACVVCSSLDASRLGTSRPVVLPNCYPKPAQPVGREAVASPPTILLAGFLPYEPNLDAARWLVDEIAPRLWAVVPDARIRIVGYHGGNAAELADPPRVEVVGEVPTMLPELQLADLVVAPVRFGSGTRTKILEAFAHRIPVVSTTLGAEGLDVEPARHLLIADGAAQFADACRRALRDQQLRGKLAAEAQAYFLARHEPAQFRRTVQELAVSVAAREKTERRA